MRVSKAMKIINNKVDHDVKRSVRHTERADHVKVSCRPGCNYCCNFLVMATVTEVIPIVERLGKTGMQPLLPGLIEDAKYLAEPTTTLESYTNFWKPCKLLVDGLCSVYKERPMSCRSHVVFSPPEKCNNPNGISQMLQASKKIVAHYTIEMHRNELWAASAPLQYQLLLLYYLNEQDTMDEWNRLLKTPALHLESAFAVWEHMSESPFKEDHRKKLPRNVSVYPIWEHFNDDGSVKPLPQAP